jgi:hypothetical protein
MRLNRRAYGNAGYLIRDGQFVFDERDDWSEHQPSAEQENLYIEQHGWRDYALWYLGIDEERDENTKGRYNFPFGDFGKVHRCGLLAAESRAGQRKYHELELAIAHLHGMLDASSSKTTRGAPEALGG